MTETGVRIGLTAAVILSACLTAGCGTVGSLLDLSDWKEWTPSSTSLQIASDGTVTETIFDTLDESYYSENELQDMIARSVREYNEEHGADCITVPAYSVQDGQVMAALVYRTPEDYVSYNKLTLYSGPILSAQMEGYLFSGTFQEVSGGTVTDSSVSPQTAMARKEYSVAISDPGHTVEVPGQIRYISSNASLVNSHVAAPGGEVPTQETEEGLVLPSSAVYHREAESESADEAARREDLTYLYIIYEPDSDPLIAPYAEGGSARQASAAEKKQ